MTEHPNHETQIAIEGFEQVDSLVSGVTVYAPKSKPQEQEETRVYDCPNCGASTAYDVAGGGIACEHCGYISPIKLKTLGKIADEFEFTLETIYDTSAVVYYLKAIPWQVEGFDPTTHTDALMKIHNIIEGQGKFVATAHRFIIVAKKKAPMT